MALIIGSTAMHHHFPAEFRKPKDFDYFGPATDVSRMNEMAEYWNLDVKDRFWHDSLEGSVLDRDGHATLDELYTIKISHAQWDLKNGSWGKHIADIIWMKNHGAQFNLDLHNLLYKIWIEVHGAKKMNLAQAAGNFFADAVVRIYDHDSIHDSVAYNDHPLYEAILKDGESVDIDPDKMWSMDYETQVKLFREEIAATALERWMIPTNYKFSPGKAYSLALRKTCTSLTKGKSARFILLNIEDFIKPHEYMKIHNAKRHLLKPLDPAKVGMM
jgi:hypothetical protein